MSIGTLRTDKRGEYVSKEFEEFHKSKGIRHELTVPYSPAQNGVAETLNRTLMESVRTMIRFARLPDSYWGEAVATAAYIRNRVPTSAFKERVLEMVPKETRPKSSEGVWLCGLCPHSRLSKKQIRQKG